MTVKRDHIILSISLLHDPCSACIWLSSESGGEHGGAVIAMTIVEMSLDGGEIKVKVIQQCHLG